MSIKCRVLDEPVDDNKEKEEEKEKSILFNKIAHDIRNFKRLNEENIIDIRNMCEEDKVDLIIIYDVQLSWLASIFKE